MNALSLQTIALTKRFGTFTALDDVRLRVAAGTVHALLGENGAGKSTLVKCAVGYHRADEGAILVDGREQEIHHPSQARRLGIGMVYQHFTVVPGMTVAENLLMARGTPPAFIDWAAERRALKTFMSQAPFQLDLDRRPQDLSAGEKQKLEILKQLYLQPRLLILDEPTSVLTPQEADEVLGALRKRAHSGLCTVLMITHKFREVMAYADEVTVLRRGRTVCAQGVAGSSPDGLAQAMVGANASKIHLTAHGTDEGLAQGPSIAPRRDPAEPPSATQLQIEDLTVRGDRGEKAVRGLSLSVNTGEIVGVAGVSGNGQRELMEALCGQRRRESGSVRVCGVDYRATRAQSQQLRVRGLPEEPLRNACVGRMSIADNLSLRGFDRPPLARWGWRRFSQINDQARELARSFKVKMRSEHDPLSSLSGGNVQRAVLARELSEPADILLVSNPCFGLDFTAVAEVHRRLRLARDQGTALLMVGEDLDELLGLADRIVVMSEGRIVHSCQAAQADRLTIGQYMGGSGAAA